MSNISKYEHKKELQKTHNRGVTRKTGENLIRAFAEIAPPFKVIADMVFSLVDAERAQAIEDFMIWAQGRLLEHGIDIYKLGENQKEIQDSFEKVIESQNLKIEDLQMEIVNLYQRASYLNNEELKNLSVASKQIKNNTDVIRSDTAEMKEFLYTAFSKTLSNDSDNTKVIDILGEIKHLIKNQQMESKDELIIKFGDVLVENIELMIDKGELNNAYDIMKTLVSLKNFINLDNKIKVNLLAIYGRILFDLEKIKELKVIVNQLLSIDTISKRKCFLIYIYSIERKNRKLFDYALNGYREVGFKDPEIEVLSQYYFFTSGDIDKIIKALCFENASEEYNIKPKYQEFRKAYEYIGLAFFIKEDFVNAKRFFIRANELKKTPFYKYRILFCDAGTILSRVGSIKTLNDSEKQTLLDAYGGLTGEDIIKYFAERSSVISMEYWRIRLIIQMYLNKENALKEYDQIPDDVKKHSEIQLKFGDLLLFTGKTDKAQLIYNELYKKDKIPGVLSRIFDSLIFEEKYVNILEMVDTITDESFYKNVFICKAIVFATFFTEGFEKANQLADEYLKKVNNPTILIFEVGHLNANSGQINLAREYFEKGINSIPTDNYPLRIEIARECSDHGFDDLAIKVLKPFIKYNENGKKQYIDMILHFRKEKLYQEAGEIVNEELAKSDDKEPWLKRKVDLENFQGHKNTALKTGEELFEITKSPDVAYNLMVLKSELGLSDYSKYSDVLSVQKEPVYVMAAAICYKYDGNFLLAKEFGYRALALDRSDFNEILFVQYIQMHLMNFPKEELPKIEQVIPNASIHLKSEKDLLWITIDSDKSLFNDMQPLKFAGSIHYHEHHDDVIQMLDKGIGEKVIVECKEYEIIELIPNYVLAFRYCLETYTKNVPDSDFIHSIPVNLDDPFTNIIPELEAMRKSDSEMIDRYNNVKEFGMPLWILAQKKSRNLTDSMIFILEKSAQPYYTGEIRRFDFKNINIVLSPTSILVLGLLNKIELLSASQYKYFITQSTKDYFKTSIQKSRQDKQISATIGLNDDGRIFSEKIKKENWNKRQKFFRDIYDVFSKLNVKKIELSSEELDNKKTIISLIGRSDYESILLAKEVEGIYIADDLFLRKVFRMIHQNNMHSNSTSFLFDHYQNNIDEFIKIQKILSDWDYQRLYDSEMIIDTIKALNNQSQIIGPGTVYDIFETVIHNSMRIQIGFSIYEKELLSAIFTLYDFRSVQNYEYCFKIILKKIVMYYSFYGNDDLILKAKIKLLLGKYPLRKRYFLDLLEDVLRLS